MVWWAIFKWSDCDGISQSVRSRTLNKYLIFKTTFRIFLKFNICECFAFMYVCEPWGCNAQRDQDKVSDPLELVLQTAVRYCVGAGSWIQVLCETRKCCKLLKHLSSPKRFKFNHFCLCVCTHESGWSWMSEEGIKTWSWSYKVVVSPWTLVLGPLPEQYMILTAKSSIYCKTKEFKYIRKARGRGGFICFLFCLFCLWGRISLGSSGWLGTRRVLGSKVCASTPGSVVV